jgi:hypothetical protein
MVKAILESRKSMTRRIIKPQPPAEATSAGVIATSRGGPTDLWTWLSGDPRDCDTWEPLGDFKTGYVQGMRLWVREACRAEDTPTGIDGVRYAADDAWRVIENTPEASDAWVKLYHYRGWGKDGIGKPVPSIHMPRWASRITLEVTAVRVQRLQEISEGDAEAEGCNFFGDQTLAYKGKFAALWGEIHGPGAWDLNPWVVAITFERVD